MGLMADTRAWMLQKSAPVAVRYGKPLLDQGRDLPAPRAHWVPTRHGEVRCWLYRPVDGTRDRNGALPVYVHLHGGSFIMRHPAMDDFFARHVAATCRAVVVNVDYDVAPQARYPVAQHQAHDVIAWLSEHGDELGLDGDRLAVGGFSAGGNLAAAAALQAVQSGRATPVLQLLGVPSLDVSEGVEAKLAGVSRSMVSAGLLRLVRETYFRDADRREEALASPLRAPDLAGLPPALVVTAERDVLRWEAERYVERLSRAGVEVQHLMVPNVDHYFLEGTGCRPGGCWPR